ncbi:MAG TPA: TIGR00730 family Rossman fold protein [Rhizomicrobium sp.]|nr:TIGR00730 family Rossman fold protein [Rhizomicrobium sp.]
MDNTRPKIGVFCGSSHGSDAAYTEAARRFGRLIGERGFDLVFGGGYIGLMGEVAHAAREAGAYVTGVLPDFLRHLEPPSRDTQRMLITDNLFERKRLMLELSDGFAVLPGGLGTYDEFFEVITAAQLDVFDKPIVLLDTKDVFAPLVALLDATIASGFAQPRVTSLYHRARTPEQAIEHLAERARRAPPG